MAYGHLFPPDKKRRIEVWLDKQPCDWEPGSACSTNEATLVIYIDWLHWSISDALLWLEKLDRCERRFRAAGLAYHAIPYQLRHSTFMLPGSHIDQLVLTRLSNILETDTPRRLQTFFMPWMEIYKAAVQVVDHNKTFQLVFINNIDHMRSAVTDAELKLSKLVTTYRSLNAGLEWLEKAVMELSQRSRMDAREALTAKFSREGSLFRRWIQTFLEVEKGLVDSKASYTEEYVEGVLERGVGPGSYWSDLVQ
ncbi:hypothetical protein J1614_011201 [Plenodomus biglobosus]|nr:hypothetical protein J1614_011201 [Plenodomus biglobosus]